VGKKKKKLKVERLSLKAWGQLVGDSENEQGVKAVELEEVCFLGDPKMLRKIAKHLKYCAKNLKKWDHHHMNNHKHGVEVIVLRPESMEEH
jgi:hypothetical protein